METLMAAAAERRTVTFAASDRLPRICLRCGVTQGVKRRRLRLRWIPPVAYLGLPLGLLPYFIVVLLTQRTADVQLPFCEPCNGAWLNTTLVQGGLIVTGVVSVLVALTVGFNGTPLVGGVLALVSTAALTLAWRRVFPPPRLRLRRIDPGGIVLFDGVNSVATEAIESMYAEEDE